MKTNYSFENVTISFTARMNKGLLLDPPLILFLTWTRDCSSAAGVLCEAKYGARKTRNCEKPGFCHRQKWPQKKEPKFSSVKWSKTSCEEGEEIELTANVQDIADGNMVTLHKKAIYYGGSNE